MRPRLSMITLFRSPMKTLVTFVLLLATSFAFVSRGAEYAATVREIDRAEAEYTAVGTVQRTTNSYYDFMDAAGMGSAEYIECQSTAVLPIGRDVPGIIEASPYVARSEIRQVSGGFSEELTNVVEQPLSALPDYSDWSWFWTKKTFEMDSCFVIARPNSENYFAVPSFTVDDVLIAADDSVIHVGQTISVWEKEIGSDKELQSRLFGDLAVADRYLLALNTELDSEKSDFKVIIDYVDCPVVNLSRLERDYGVTDYVSALREPEKYGIPTVSSDGTPVISTLDCMRILYHNFHTSEVVYTSDMSLIHKFKSGDMYISDGRALEVGETADVCIVGADFAALNGLAVGDTVTLDLTADTLTHSGKVFAREAPYPASPDVFGEYRLTERGLPDVQKAFEIVGIWTDGHFDVEDPYTYALNTIFVPASCCPWVGQIEPAPLPSTFSFELEHPGDMALIQDELGDKLAAMGYELVIDDEGYAAAKPSFDFMKLSSLIGFVGMALALLLSLILITYLFIIRKKHDYAIMRALGTPVPRANASLLVGLFALALAAVLLGTALAVLATSGFAADLSSQIGEVTGGEVAATLPGWTFGAFGAGTLALLLVFAWVGLVRIGRIPPLALLQNRT